MEEEEEGGRKHRHQEETVKREGKEEVQWEREEKE